MTIGALFADDLSSMQTTTTLLSHIQSDICRSVWRKKTVASPLFRYEVQTIKFTAILRRKSLPIILVGAIGFMFPSSIISP